MANNHGMSNSRIYRIWSDMKTRCHNKNSASYKNYGGRGVTLCKRWEIFENFYKDMGDIPRGKTIERIHNEMGYSPDNCRWATQKEQANNKRNNVILVHNGESLTAAQWSDKLKVSRAAIYQRIEYGWSEEQIFTIPFNKTRGSIKSVTHNGEVLTLKGWSLRLSKNPALVSLRLSRGWPTEKAITTPVRNYLCQ